MFFKIQANFCLQYFLSYIRIFARLFERGRRFLNTFDTNMIQANDFFLMIFISKNHSHNFPTFKSFNLQLTLNTNTVFRNPNNSHFKGEKIDLKFKPFLAEMISRSAFSVRIFITFQYVCLFIIK